MTREDFIIFVSSAAERGFSHVLTSSGPVELADWHPYGGFGGDNPAIEAQVPGFEWLGPDVATDAPGLSPTADRPEHYGYWQFLPAKRAGEIIEFERSQLKRKRK